MPTEIQITINDQSVVITAGSNLAQILAKQGLDQGCFVAVVNNSVVPKTTLDQCPIHEGDQIEILSPISGG